MTITGSVAHFVRLEPAFARMVGEAGTEIKKTITITREKDYPFKIVNVRARKGSNIAFALEEFSKKDGDGYILTIENRKTASGRYADSLILTTDSSIKPTITVPVYGQIYKTAPAPSSAPSATPEKKPTQG